MGLQLRLLLAVHSHATMLQQRAYLNTSENEEDADDIFSLLASSSCIFLLLQRDPQLNFLRVSAKEATFLLHVVIVVVAAAALLLYWGSGCGGGAGAGAGRSIKPNDVQPPK